MTNENNLKKMLYGELSVSRLFRIRDRAIKLHGIPKIINKIIYMRILNKKGAYIPIDCKIGANVVFPHGIEGVYISSGSRIGNGCVIFHQVTIGSNTLLDSKRNGCPTIGENVYIGAGAKIIGDVKIGDNVRIGANCVVTKNVDSNSTIVLSEPRVIYHDDKLNNKFISYGEYIKKLNQEHANDR